ncbi:dTDP-4-dehydrorhamnose reductase [Prosthecomicrobium sp. N25]|uniref:dTDP-4-dehydrorhamnose reductase n=1 Tax=Prosthecomicrobium sp. N25 TaxID=3129254 RepID=UPI0030788CE4
MAGILLTGSTGQVGAELAALDWPEGLTPIAPARAELDLADRASIEHWLMSRDLAGILSVGAYTAVDKAESEVAEAWSVNALAPAVLAAHAARRGIPIVQVSTDYVFDGSKAGPYDVDDPVRPLGVYGASKEGGEQAVRTARARHAILRTSWVVGAHGANFVRTMLRLGRERPVLRVVDDQWGAPALAADVAAVLQTMMIRLVRDPAAPTGTFHFTSSGETTWCGLARAVFEASRRHGGPAPDVQAIATADYPTPARRPANSRLSLERLRNDYGITPRPWQAGIDSLVERLLAEPGQQGTSP